MGGARPAFLPLAITFGGAALLFALADQPAWFAFLPVALTFFVLWLVRDDEPEDDDDASEAA